MSERPSVVLKRCPICGDEPYWHYARNTTRKRGRECFIFSGCAHAQKLGADRIVDDPKDWREVEKRWADFFESALADTTKRWTDLQRDAFRRRLLGKNTLPGATDQIEFPPDAPAQSEPRTNESPQ